MRAVPVTTVLVVCSGNICRSPMAEGILRHLAQERGLALEIRGAGTLLIDGAPPDEGAIEACAEHGIDISGLRSTPLDKEAIAWADRVLVMDSSHIESCRALAPGANIEILGHWSKTLPGEAIADPVGQPLDAFRSTYRLIVEACEAWVADQLDVR